MFSERPIPPFSAENPQDLSDHVAEHSEEWLLYFRNLNAHLSQVEEFAHEKSVLLDKAQETVASKDAVILYQKENIAELNAQLIRAQVEKERAIDAAQPAVLPARPVASRLAAEPPLGHAERETPTLATPPSESSRPSEKLPDPEVFKGQRSDLRRFVQQICGKMTANADRFPTAQSRLIYVAGRLKDDAYNLILPKTLYGVPQFVDYQQLLEYLEQAFGDPDRVQNAQNRLYNLKQKNQDFSVYFSEFQRLALEGEMPEGALTPLLYQGISRELQDMLLHNPPTTREFRPFSRHLQELDNRFRQHQQQTRRAGENNRTPATRPTTATPAARAPAVTATVQTALAQPDPNAMDLSAARRPPPRYQPSGRKERGECYRCGSPDHRVANCSFPPPANRPTQVKESRFTGPNLYRGLEYNRAPSPTLSEEDEAKGGASI
jgi:hypothetical protein